MVVRPSCRARVGYCQDILTLRRLGVTEGFLINAPISCYVLDRGNIAWLLLRYKTPQNR